MVRKRLCRLVVALSIAAAARSATAQQPVHKLPQGWSDEVRNRFWFTGQGSRILPYDWFLHLERAGSRDTFRSPEHMEELRYITLAPMENPSSLNPDGLPIGFVRDRDKESDTDWLGLTCAACHTNALDVAGTRYLVEGAPTLANFPLFFAELIAALENTDTDAAKFARFAAAVLGTDLTSAAASDLHGRLHELALALATRQRINSVAFPDYPGYGRLDAFANIMNQVVAVGLDDPENGNPANAPVSYPFLWGTPQSDVVQWNGSAPNTLLVGPMVRNVGEVVGVFGGVQIEPRRWWQFWKKVGYESTIRMVALGQLEEWLWSLRAPRWADTSLSGINPALAARGKTLYEENQRCSACHEIVPEHERYNATMVPLDDVRTDPNMATNFAKNSAKTWRLAGTRSGIIAGKRFGQEARSFEMVVNAVVGVILRHPLQALDGMRRGQAGATNEPLAADSMAAVEPLAGSEALAAGEVAAAHEAEETTQAAVAGEAVQRLVDQSVRTLLEEGTVGAYKARPLTGIWATAPYLHNGSVANLKELLLPAAQRSPRFFVGTREYDEENVGFKTTQTPATTLFDTSLPGNTNTGHEYGTELGDDDRRALLEYLKTL